MASLRLHLLLVLPLLVQTLLMFSSPVTADDEENKLLGRINSYRMSLRLPAFAVNDNADCLAEEISDQLEDQPCPAAITPRLPEAQFSTYPKPLDKCHLNLNNTRDGAILLSCIPGRAKSLTAFNFTDPIYSRFLNNSKYIGAGVGHEDEWIVVVLTTNSPGGNFVASSASTSVVPNSVAKVASLVLGYWIWIVLFVGLYV